MGGPPYVRGQLPDRHSAAAPVVEVCVPELVLVAGPVDAAVVEVAVSDPVLCPGPVDSAPPDEDVAAVVPPVPDPIVLDVMPVAGIVVAATVVVSSSVVVALESSSAQARTRAKVHNPTARMTTV